MLGGELADHLETFQEGEVLFEEGDWGNTIFLVKEGEIEIIRHENGTEHLVSVIGPGEVLGEMTMLRDESERSATARARTDVESYKFLERQMDELLRDNENFRRKLLSILTSRLHETTTKWSTAASNQELMYVGAILGLKMFHLLSDKDSPTIELSEDMLEVSDRLDVHDGTLSIVLNNPTLDDLRSLPRDQRTELTQFAADVLGKIQSELSFRPVTADNEQSDVTVGGDPDEILEDLMRLKRVNTKLDTHEENHYDNLERESFKTYWRMYNELERVIETVDPDHLPEPRLYDRLQSEVKTLKEHLDRCDFDVEELRESS